MKYNFIGLLVYTTSNKVTQNNFQYMFEVIHEFAILGTASFMMALATIWYSPMMFGKIWMKETGLTDEMVENAQPDMMKHAVMTFISYVVMLGVLGHVVAYASKIGLTPLDAAFIIVLFTAASAVATTLFEGKSLRYYFIRVGFYAVFIIVGTLMLQYWPW